MHNLLWHNFSSSCFTYFTTGLVFKSGHQAHCPRRRQHQRSGRLDGPRVRDDHRDLLPQTRRPTGGAAGGRRSRRRSVRVQIQRHPALHGTSCIADLCPSSHTTQSIMPRREVKVKVAFVVQVQRALRRERLCLYWQIPPWFEYAAAALPSLWRGKQHLFCKFTAA